MSGYEFKILLRWLLKKYGSVRRQWQMYFNLLDK